MPDGSFQFRRLRRHFKNPLQTGSGTVSHVDRLLLRVESAEGIGWGEVAPWPTFPVEKITDALNFLEAAKGNLAALYASGGLGQQQFDAAAEWFEQAANRGMTDSQFNLGMLYARGLGVKQDMAASYKWFSLAARRGDKDAATARDDVARSLGADDVARISTEIDAFAPAAIDVPANYAPLGTWSASFDPGQPITKLEVVKGVQTLLGQLGYDVGTPDGVAGPKTAEAIRQFERAAGMSESGAINPRLLAVLASQPA